MDIPTPPPPKTLRSGIDLLIEAAKMIDNYTPEFKPAEYPPFPDDITIADLPTFHLAHLSTDPASSSGRELYRVCRQRGCFYLKADFMNGNDAAQEAQELMHLLEPLFKLPLEEKIKYIPANPLLLFGYKAIGASVVDDKDTPDNAEFFNVSRMKTASPCFLRSGPFPDAI